MPKESPLLEAIDLKIRSLSSIIQTLSPQLEPLKDFARVDTPVLHELLDKLRASDATVLDDALVLGQSTDTKLLEAFEQIKLFEFENAIALIETYLSHSDETKE